MHILQLIVGACAAAPLSMSMWIRVKLEHNGTRTMGWIAPSRIQLCDTCPVQPMLGTGRECQGLSFGYFLLTWLYLGIIALCCTQLAYDRLILVHIDLVAVLFQSWQWSK